MEFIDIVFKDDEQKLNACVKEYNKLCQCNLYPKILEYTHYDLANSSDIPDTKLWKEFLLNPRVKEWLKTERAIILDTSIQKLLTTVGTDHSTATVQALNSLLAQQKLVNEAQENKPIIIYQFVPLTEEERKNPNVNISENIPSGIRRAIRQINTNTTDNKK